jgi:hypothetical protein
VYGDTPLPVETPTAPNPPDGAIIDYYLRRVPAGDLKLTITDSRGNVVRIYSSVAPPAPTLFANVPSYWFAPSAVLTKQPGMNRFVWNLRLPNPKVLPFGYSGAILSHLEYTLADHAIPGQTPREQPEGALVVPGEYTVELAAGGRTEKQSLTVKEDPRVRASREDLLVQFDVAKHAAEALAVTYDGYSALARLRAGIVDRLTSVGDKSSAPDLVTAAKALDERASAIQNGTPAARGLGLVNRDMARYFNMLQSSDSRPATMLRSAITETCEALNLALAAWRHLASRDIPAFNATLQQRQLPPLPDTGEVPAQPACR